MTADGHPALKRALASTAVASLAFLASLVVGNLVPSTGSLLLWAWYASFGGLGLVASIWTARRASGLTGRARRKAAGGGVIAWGIVFPIGFVILAYLSYDLLHERVSALPSGFMVDVFVFRYIVLLGLLEGVAFFVGFGATSLYEWATTDSGGHDQPRPGP